MVQNPQFAPRMRDVHVLRFPTASEMRTPSDADPLYARLRRSDRGYRYFATGDAHYEHYAGEISRVLDDVRPNLVVGESTQAHELITIELCKRRGINYLFPLATAYPPGRLFFYREDSMMTVGGSGKAMPADAAEALIDGVNNRSIVPTYMKKQGRFDGRRLVRHLTDRVRTSLGWLRGERFATPAPWRKLQVDRAHARHRQRWSKLAKQRAGLTGPYVLFPLHMQPECSIDVWGQQWNNQAAILQRAAAALAKIGISVVVKPNPKAKYDIDRQLCDVAESSPNVYSLDFSVPMRNVWSEATAILSVTGTVLLEAVFSGKTAFSFTDIKRATLPGVILLNSPEEISDHLQIKIPEDQVLVVRARARIILDTHHACSYGVEWIDPLWSAERITDAYGQDLAHAFLDIINQSNGPDVR